MLSTLGYVVCGHTAGRKWDHLHVNLLSLGDDWIGAGNWLDDRDIDTKSGSEECGRKPASQQSRR